MSRVIAIVACGFTVAACSASMPSLFSSSPSTETLRFESEPPGAEVKTSSGQTCRTPCEVTVQPASELSATLALNGYQLQTVSLHAETPAGASSARLAPNPVFVDLKPVTPPAKKKLKRKVPVEAARSKSSVASAAAPAPASASASAPASAPTQQAPAAPSQAAPERAASATNYPWPDPPAANSGK
jgi:hypothetical protein